MYGNKDNDKTFSTMSNLQTDCCLKLSLQKVEQHTRDELLILGIKHRNDSQVSCKPGPPK